jgi:hypothetical protein
VNALSLAQPVRLIKYFRPLLVGLAVGGASAFVPTLWPADWPRPLLNGSASRPPGLYLLWSLPAMLIQGPERQWRVLRLAPGPYYDGAPGHSPALAAAGSGDAVTCDGRVGAGGRRAPHSSKAAPLLSPALFAVWSRDGAWENEGHRRERCGGSL